MCQSIQLVSRITFGEVQLGKKPRILTAVSTHDTPAPCRGRRFRRLTSACECDSIAPLRNPSWVASKKAHARDPHEGLCYNKWAIMFQPCEKDWSWHALPGGSEVLRTTSHVEDTTFNNQGGNERGGGFVLVRLELEQAARGATTYRNCAAWHLVNEQEQPPRVKVGTQVSKASLEGQVRLRALSLACRAKLSSYTPSTQNVTMLQDEMPKVF